MATATIAMTTTAEDIPVAIGIVRSGSMKWINELMNKHSIAF
jgi:hypothetical protein